MLFSRLSADASLKKGQESDFEAMAIKWCDSVNGKTIMPKLPVYLRVYHETYLKNQRIKQALKKAALASRRLTKLNAAAAAPNSTAAAASGSSAAASASASGSSARLPPAPLPQHPRMPQPPAYPSNPADESDGESDRRQIVGGTTIAHRQAAAAEEKETRKPGVRGPDKARQQGGRRAARRCGVCGSDSCFMPWPRSEKKVPAVLRSRAPAAFPGSRAPATLVLPVHTPTRGPNTIPGPPSPFLSFCLHSCL